MATTVPIQKLTADDVRRFWEKVDKSGPIHPYDPSLGNCWVWKRALFGGYGAFRMGKRQVKAHRVSYLLHNGENALPLCLHSCSNRKCVNPAHLRAGTVKQNNEDREAHGHTVRGEKHWRIKNPERVPRGSKYKFAKITEATAAKIKAEYIPFVVSQHMLARKYACSRDIVRSIVIGKCWKHVV